MGILGVLGHLIRFLMLFAGALCIGFVSAITGIGGGSLIVPFMVLVFDYDIKAAIATSLICIVVTSSSAASEYIRKGMVDFKTALILEPTTALGAIVGAHITITLPSRIVRGVLGILLLYISLTMLRRALITRGRLSRGSTVSGFTPSNPYRLVAGILLAFVAGVASGMFGIGGGVLKVPLMTMILGIPIKTAVATSSFMVGLTAASGGLVYLIKGFPDPYSVVALSAGIIPGASMGARLMGRLRPRVVRLAFSIILLYASVRLLYSLIA